MTGLDNVIPAPAFLGSDRIDLAIPQAQAWEILRDGDLASFPLVHVLFARPRGFPLRLSDLNSGTQDGFQVLYESDPDDVEKEIVVGAIGKLWHLEIPFVHLDGIDAFRSYSEAGYVKVAWAIRISSLGAHSRVDLEFRVDATDGDAWARFKRYVSLVDAGTRFLRSAFLADLARRYGAQSKTEERPLAGDDRLPDAQVQLTHSIDIHAKPEIVWSGLGFEHIGPLDSVGSEGDDRFEVLALDRARSIVLGALYDADAKKQQPFAAERHMRFWQTTWSFVLEPVSSETTRLYVRGRASFPATGEIRAEWMRPIHPLIEREELRRLAMQIEQHSMTKRSETGSRTPGPAELAACMREGSSRWGVTEALAARAYPGDDLVSTPRWHWTHGIEVDAPVEDVWPWIAQLGAVRGGFYSYQWPENASAGELRNTSGIYPERPFAKGDAFVVHPNIPPFRVLAIDHEQSILAHAKVGTNDTPWAEASWLFFLEATAEGHSRIISRYRCTGSSDLDIRFCPKLGDPVGFAMDRRMLLGVKARVEKRRIRRPPRSGTRRVTTPKKVELR